MSEPWTILGCGYVGERLARRLAGQGVAVVASTRREERAAELRRIPGVEVVVGDVGVRGGIVVDSIPGEHQPVVGGARRVVYLSATSVYGRGDGSWVDEDTPPRPDSPRGKARVAMEEAVHRAADAAGVESVALRIAAIHGPGRGVAERLRSGTYRVIGDGSTWSNRIHVDELVERILYAATISPLPRRCYVVSDGRPTTSREYADALAAQLGLPAPPSVPVESVSAEAAEMALGNRRLRTLWGPAPGGTGSPPGAGTGSPQENHVVLPSWRAK